MNEQNLDSGESRIEIKPSLIEYFGIEGLFGYRSVSLSSNYAATILIAKNGAGKTTLLGAMDAFLKGQFVRFSDLTFSKIECRLRGISQPLILLKSDVDEMIQSIKDNLKDVADSNNLDPIELYSFLTRDYPLIKSSNRALGANPVFMKIYSKPSQSMISTKRFFEQCEVRATSTENERITFVRQSILSVLGDIEVVYLPTYRRIELPLPEDEDRRTGSEPSNIQAKLGLGRLGLQSSEIQFGLSDISRRLAQLNQDLLIQSNQGYREISANIINDLLNGTFERESPGIEEPPNQEALALFFSRLEDGRHFVGPYSDFRIPDLNRIYDTERIPESSRKFLAYFLGKLNIVIRKTHDVESVVEEFVSNCNAYLSAHDNSVGVHGGSSHNPVSEDAKVLELNRRNLGVSVFSLTNRRKIPLAALSSGEKQMISLFARLYLYPKKKIFLIDEPELSLSLDWQRKILIDIMSAPSCEQLVAITHSPFVFDNPLEPYATSLRVKINTEVSDTPNSNEDEDEDQDGVHE